MKKAWLKGVVNFFSVDFNSTDTNDLLDIDTNDILDIHKYFMKGKCCK